MQKRIQLIFLSLVSHFTSRSWCIYLFTSSFILGWWTLAFYVLSTPSSYTPPSVSNTRSTTYSSITQNLLAEISPLSRAQLHQALSGNFSLMTDFIVKWNQDAQLLSQKGFHNIQFLPQEVYQQALMTGNLLTHSPRKVLRTLNRQLHTASSIEDDRGHTLSLNSHFQHFLPQTYLAASFLLSIAHPDEIVALPSGLRYLHQLYFPEQLAQISQDMHHIHGERLHLLKPDLAFIAPYSHPAVIETLQRQHISLYSIEAFNTFEQIEQSLLKVGQITQHTLEARLLAIFMRACLLNIDNRLQAINQAHKVSTPSKRLLYLSYHQHYTLPTQKTLSGQMLTHALKQCTHLICKIPDSQKEWSIPFEQEKILRIQPDFLMISLPHYSQKSHQLPLSILNRHSHHSASVFYLDEIVLEFPSQYLLLGYFDLFQALIGTYA